MRASLVLALGLVGCITQRSYLPSLPAPLPDTQATAARTPLDDRPVPATAPAEPRSPRLLVAGPVMPLWRASPRNLFALQQALASRGYYHGPKNGVPSTALDVGLRRFQADAGTPITGRVDAATARALGL